jgi:hypothetical protein
VNLAGGTLGSATNPLLLVVDGGDLDLSGIQVQGVIVGHRTPFTVTGAGSVVRGAIIATGSFRAGGALSVVHDIGTLERLRWTSGSFVAVPGSWKDF